jgi:methylated-DNA-protein-cysteine methyltransferase related protein
MQRAETEFEKDVLAVLAALEPGDLVTYGEVAAEAGHPGAARAVGRILATSEGLSWWRVVPASGRLNPDLAAHQSKLLAADGVATKDGRIVR